MFVLYLHFGGMEGIRLIKEHLNRLFGGDQTWFRLSAGRIQAEMGGGDVMELDADAIKKEKDIRNLTGHIW